jgi:hypothetical protein
VVTLAEEVVEGNTFLYHTWRGGNGDDNESCAVRGQLTSTAVTLDRALSVNAINGRCYVVESLSGDFTVQSDSITLTDPDTETTATLTTTAPVAKTFLVGSMKTTNGVSGDNNRTIPYIELQDVAVPGDADTIHLLRESGAFGVIAEVFTITFNAGGAENVQRGVHVQSTPTDDEAIELPAPVGTLSTSMVMTPSNGTFKNGALDGSGSNDNPDSQCALTFVDDSNIRFEKSIHGVDPTARWSWEVIEWELSAGGSTRRVMVIS